MCVFFALCSYIWKTFVLTEDDAEYIDDDYYDDEIYDV